jgi:hypothetical protein
MVIDKIRYDGATISAFELGLDLMSLSSLQERLRVASTEFEKLQADHSLAIAARQRLEAQLTENEAVKKVRPTPVKFGTRSPLMHRQTGI